MYTTERRPRLSPPADDRVGSDRRLARISYRPLQWRNISTPTFDVGATAATVSDKPCLAPGSRKERSR
jgi:hypothetical protein